MALIGQLAVPCADGLAMVLSRVSTDYCVQSAQIEYQDRDYLSSCLYPGPQELKINQRQILTIVSTS
jgi:hypothetical protein